LAQKKILQDAKPGGFHFFRELKGQLTSFAEARRRALQA